MAELRIEGHDVVIELGDDETLLSGLNRAGYTAQAGCRRGGCGICKVDLTMGRTEYAREVAESVVTDAERAGGTVLLCRALALSDVTIGIPPGFRFGCISQYLAALARPKS